MRDRSCAGALRWPTCTYFGVAHDLQREPHHFVRHRRREEQRLARRPAAPAMMRRTSGQKPMSIMRSASSSTSSSMPLRVGVLLPHVIHQPARRGDDDVDAGFERALLHAHLDAAVDRGAGDGGVIGEAVDFVLDLHRELARRREHEHAALRGRCRAGRVGARRRAAAAAAIGTTNAAVLPVPVSAQAIRSCRRARAG